MMTEDREDQKDLEGEREAGGLRRVIWGSDYPGEYIVHCRRFRNIVID